MPPQTARALKPTSPLLLRARAGCIRVLTSNLPAARISLPEGLLAD